MKTLEQAARIANAKIQTGPLTFEVAADIYAIAQGVGFENPHAFSKEQRLTIEAELLPDDPAWTPAAMPVFRSTQDPRPPSRAGAQTDTVC